MNATQTARNDLKPESQRTDHPVKTTDHPVKTYTIMSDGIFSRRSMELRCEDQAIMRLVTPRLARDQRPHIDLSATVDGRQIMVAIAEVRRSTWSRHFDFKLHDTEHSVTGWSTVSCRGFTEWCFEFSFLGRYYCWERTHDSRLGASRLSTQCYKLVDGTYESRKRDRKQKVEGKVLMAYNHALMFRKDLHYAGEVRLMNEDMDRDLQHVALVIVFGIQEREREARRQALREMAKNS